MTFVAAVCPQCAGALQVPDDRDIVKCMYCGVDVVVRQAIRLVQGNTENLLKLAEAAREATNNVEAIQYYNRVLENDPNNAIAWFGKGVSVGWSSTLVDFRFQEMLVAFENAIKYSEANETEEIQTNVAQTINQIAIACYSLARKHAVEYIALDGTWAEYITRSEAILSILISAHLYSPTNQQIIVNIIDLCKDNIEGIAYNDQYDNDLRKAVHLSDSYEKEVRGLLELYGDKLKKLNPSYQTPEAKRPSAGCFVMTATLGDVNHPSVRLLRAFRDEILHQTSFGRIICRFYYRHGPTLAAAIERYPLARKISYWCLVVPGVIAVRLSYRLRTKYRNIAASE